MPANPSPRSSTATALRRSGAVVQCFARIHDELHEAHEALSSAFKVALLVGVPAEELKLLPWAKPHRDAIDAAAAREATPDERREAQGLLARDERRAADAAAEAQRAAEQRERRERHDRRRRNVADGLPPEPPEPNPGDAGSQLVRSMADRHAATQR